MRNGHVARMGACLLMSGVIVSSTDAKAHPHAWIDFEASVITDSAGHVKSVQVNWVFDDFYTAFIADEIVKSGGDPREGLIDVGRTNLLNLREFDYFADLRADGTALEILDVERFETGIDEDRIWLRFELELAEAVDPVRQTFTYSFYDPTYYVEVLHREGFAPVVEGRRDCAIAIAPPNPTPELIAFAYSLDQTDEAPDTLGKLFAEKAELVCG